MKSGGFPCRFAGCDVRFQVMDQSSMQSLLAASGQRTQHEVGTHDYHHQKIEDTPPNYAKGPLKVRPRADFV
ncbi:MAG TPA: hypothetical protein VHG53_05930 [Candidatus Limnocylindria bacterium]|nr:hypothetical protein [Candidatus Limnocylindria bacterium]